MQFTMSSRPDQHPRRKPHKENKAELTFIYFRLNVYKCTYLTFIGIFQKKISASLLKEKIEMH